MPAQRSNATWNRTALGESSEGDNKCVHVCVCVCVCAYMYVYIYIHTHTQNVRVYYILIYSFNYLHICFLLFVNLYI